MFKRFFKAKTNEDESLKNGEMFASSDASCVSEYSVLESLLSHIRSDRVRKEFFKTPEEEFTNTNEIRIWVGTYNVNGRKPPEGLDLQEMLKNWKMHWPDRTENSQPIEGADIYVCGFQEIVPLNAQNIIAGWDLVPYTWDDSINKCLNTWLKNYKNPRESESESEKKERISISKDSSSHGKDSKCGLGKDKSEQDKDVDIFNVLIKKWYGENELEVSGELKDMSEKSGIPLELSEEEDYILVKDRAIEDNTNSGEGKKVENTVKEEKEIIDSKLEQSSKKAIQVEQQQQQQDFKKKHKYPKGICDEDIYVQLFKKQLVGLYMTIWVRKSLLKHISGVQTTYVATGAMGFLRNKGAIICRMRIFDSTAVFVTSHFASGSEKGDELRRNIDFSEIVKRTEFPYENKLNKVVSEDGTMKEEFSFFPDGLPDSADDEVKHCFIGGYWGSNRLLHHNDNLIWFGDLNYRINGKNSKVIEMIRQNKLHHLLDLDQLSIERSAGRVFKGWKEGPIDFAPTFKFIQGTHFYTGEINEDSSSSGSEDDDEKLFNMQPLKLFNIDETVNIDKGAKANFIAKIGGSRSVINFPLSSEDDLSVHGGLDISAYQRAKSFNIEHKVVGGTPFARVEKIEKKPKIKKKKNKIRTPSWTDRILYHTTGRLHQILYRNFPQSIVSDHKPVCSAFLLHARCYDRKKVEAAILKARRIVDIQDLASMPRCKVHPLLIGLGTIHYRQPVKASTFIKNTGEVDVYFSFIPPWDPLIDNMSMPHIPFPKWVCIEPVLGKLPPKKEIEIKMTVLVRGGINGSADEVSRFNENLIDHILVLHIEGGSDFFISLTGTYVPSCFGLSLQNLALKQPKSKSSLNRISEVKYDLPSLERRANLLIQFNSIGSSQSKSQDALDSDDDNISKRKTLSVFESIKRTGNLPNLVLGPVGLMVPYEFLKIFHYLTENEHLKTKGIFVDTWKMIKEKAALNEEHEGVVLVRRCLDFNRPFTHDISAHDMAAALLCLFYDLPSPIIPQSVFITYRDNIMNGRSAAHLTKDAMTAVEFGVFDTALELFRSLVMPELQEFNGVSNHDVAAVLADVFFQSSVIENDVLNASYEFVADDEATTAAKISFMHYFIDPMLFAPESTIMEADMDQ